METPVFSLFPGRLSLSLADFASGTGPGASAAGMEIFCDNCLNPKQGSFCKICAPGQLCLKPPNKGEGEPRGA